MDGKATRRFRLKGKTYQAGDKVTLPAGQFRDFEGAGMVERKARSAPPDPEIQAEDA